MAYSLLSSTVHRFPLQEYWSGLPFPCPEYLMGPGMESRSPALADGCFTTEPTLKLMIEIDGYKALKKNIPGM